MDDQEANAPSSNTGFIIALVLVVLLALPCLAGVALLGVRVVFYREAEFRPPVTEVERAPPKQDEKPLPPRD